MLVNPSNAFNAILPSALKSQKKMYLTFVHAENALLSMLRTLGGIVILVRPAHASNAFSPIVLTPVKSILVRPSQP